MEDAPIPFRERKETYYRLDYYDFVKGLVTEEHSSHAYLDQIVQDKKLRWYRITKHTVETVQMAGWA